jgi:glutamate/tyrosine decarboxylase-like PLP-dependent enzyme
MNRPCAVATPALLLVPNPIGSTRTTGMRSALHAVADQAADFLESLPTRHAGGTATPEELTCALDRPLPEDGAPPELVIRELVNDVDRGLVASGGPRFFGFVMSSVTPAGLMADWLTSTWDQNAQVYTTSPAAAVVEAIAARWVIEMLGLPAASSVGFVTGCQMANFTALASARNAVLERAGWDVDKQGMCGAPPVAVFMSECAHATVRSALRLAGIGTAQIREIPADAEGRMKIDALAGEVRRAAGQLMIFSLQAGNVNSGAFEPIGAVADLVRGENAWVHVDGAFGLWAAVSPELRGHLQGMERADSWATDAHKWLNVPFDSGLVILKDAAQHRRLKASRCAYAGAEAEDRRDGSTWVPENSRRARAFVFYAVLRELGRSGVRAIVEQCCRLARQFAIGAARLPHAQVLNEVALNQVLFRFRPPGCADCDAFHRAIAACLQAEGRCWIGTTVWRGETVLRVSLCNRSTTEADIATALESVARAAQALATPMPRGPTDVTC